MLPMDCHTHTGFSPDGSGTLTQLCHQARAINLPVLAVTEHVEMNRYFSQAHYDTAPRNDWEVFSHDQVLERSLTAMKRQQQENDENFTLLCGMEMGQPNSDFALSASVGKDKRLDFIIASLHEMLDWEDFFELDYSIYDADELLETYFEELYTIAKWGKFDVLGHITYPLRYMVGEAQVSVDMKQYEEPVREIFKKVVENGCGIELNTSGYRQKYGQPFPNEELLRWYKEAGGEILTFGSDAHCAEDLGKGIAQGVELAKKCGFTRASYYKKRNPIFITL